MIFDKILQVRVPLVWYEEVQRLSEKAGWSVSKAIRETLRAHLEEDLYKRIEEMEGD